MLTILTNAISQYIYIAFAAYFVDFWTWLWLITFNLIKIRIYKNIYSKYIKYEVFHLVNGLLH